MWNILNNHVFLSLKIVSILANSADTDEMQHYAAFHLGCHSFPKYLFRGFQYTKGYGTILHGNYWKMTILLLFSYNFFGKFHVKKFSSHNMSMLHPICVL